MIYKIESFFHKTIYINNKSDLFNFIDYQTKRNNFFNVFSDRFDKSYKSGFFVREIKEIRYECGYSSYLNEYVKHLFIIRDESGYVIDYNRLLEEYNQSRNIKPYKRSYRFYDASTAKSRRSRGHAKFYESKHTYRKEYSLMCQDKKDGIKVRAKRMDNVRIQLVKFYDDDYGTRKDGKSWKEKMLKHQWQKKHL